MRKRKQVRTVIGYVISRFGKREDWLLGLDGKRWTTEDRFTAFDERNALRRTKYPHAKVFRVVSRHVVLERLRNAVVEAACRWRSAGQSPEAMRGDYSTANMVCADLFAAVDTLRAHLEKKR